MRGLVPLVVLRVFAGAVAAVMRKKFRVLSWNLHRKFFAKNDAIRNVSVDAINVFKIAVSIR